MDYLYAIYEDYSISSRPDTVIILFYVMLILQN